MGGKGLRMGIISFLIVKWVVTVQITMLIVIWTTAIPTTMPAISQNTTTTAMTLITYQRAQIKTQITI